LKEFIHASIPDSSYPDHVWLGKWSQWSYYTRSNKDTIFSLSKLTPNIVSLAACGHFKWIVSLNALYQKVFSRSSGFLPQGTLTVGWD
jgi:hypothetical protein